MFGFLIKSDNHYLNLNTDTLCLYTVAGCCAHKENKQMILQSNLPCCWLRHYLKATIADENIHDMT